MADFETLAPVPLLGGLCHFGLVEHMVFKTSQRKELYNGLPPIDATCHITQHSDPRDRGDRSRQKATGHEQVR